MKRKVVAITLVIILLAGLGAGLWVYFDRNNTAGSVVSVDINPAVEFVVNQNNKVMSVVYKNSDAETAMINVSVEGKSIEEAVQLFVEASINTGYLSINANTSVGNRQVNINVVGDTAKASKLKENLCLNINKFFDESGLYAVAKQVITENNAALKTEAENLNVSVEKYRLMLEAEALSVGTNIKDFANKTEKELLEIIKNQAKELEGIAGSLLETVNTTIDGMFNLALQTLKSALTLSLALLPGNTIKVDEDLSLEALIQSLNDQIDAMPAAYDSIKPTLKETLNTTKESLENIKTQLKEMLEEAKEQSKELFETIKTEKQNLEAIYKEQYNQYKSAYANLNEEQKNAVKEWRQSMLSA